jgi:hypothetical protein
VREEAAPAVQPQNSSKEVRKTIPNRNQDSKALTGTESVPFSLFPLHSGIPY